MYRDGELWVDADALLRTVWSIDLSWAVEDGENFQILEDGRVMHTHWLVNP